VKIRTVELRRDGAVISSVMAVIGTALNGGSEVGTR
jgi:hypothetical protein